MLFVWHLFTEYAVCVKVTRVKILLCPSSRILLRLMCIENLGLSMKTDYQLFIQESAIKDTIHTSRLCLIDCISKCIAKSENTYIK